MQGAPCHKIFLRMRGGPGVPGPAAPPETGACNAVNFPGFLYASTRYGESPVFFVMFKAPWNSSESVGYTDLVT